MRWHSRAGCCCWQSWDQAAGRAGGQEAQEAPLGWAAAHPGRRGSSRGRTAARPWPWAHRDPPQGLLWDLELSLGSGPEQPGRDRWLSGMRGRACEQGVCGTLMLFWYPPFPDSSSGQCGSRFSTSHHSRGCPHCCWQQGWLPVPISAPRGQHTAAACASYEEALPPATTPCAHTHAALPLGPAPSQNTCSFPASTAHVLAVSGPPGTGLASGWGQLFPSCVCEATRWTRSSGCTSEPSPPATLLQVTSPKGTFQGEGAGTSAAFPRRA